MRKGRSRQEPEPLVEVLRILQSLLHDFNKQALLASHGSFLCIKNFLLFLPELVRIKTLGIGHGLLANVMFGYQSEDWLW